MENTLICPASISLSPSQLHFLPIWLLPSPHLVKTQQSFLSMTSFFLYAIRGFTLVIQILSSTWHFHTIFFSKYSSLLASLSLYSSPFIASVHSGISLFTCSVKFGSCKCWVLDFVLSLYILPLVILSIFWASNIICKVKTILPSKQK
jgi:hypothetical protein